MDYQETIDYLYSRLPVFQNIGARAFKPGLHTTRELCESLRNPQNQYPTIHVGGTNGKGSTSHMLAAILQTAGYRVGLYTSPHLKDFRERIRVNGTPVEEPFIVDFTVGQQSNIDKLNPSFFEVTVVMAFAYFSHCEVDIAIIEVGMGGRLDSTNIITPIISVITNISLDHTQFLGDTLAKIAAEKAGIIKPNVPIVISEHQHEEITDVMIEKADEMHSTLIFGSDSFKISHLGVVRGRLHVNVTDQHSGQTVFSELHLDLTGSYQLQNLGGVLTVIRLLRSQRWEISDLHIQDGLSNVTGLTGLKGRWQLLQKEPVVYCDTAHNAGGLSYTIQQFDSVPHKTQRFVLGFVADKDISGILKLFPSTAVYYFCQPSNNRALNASDLAFAASNYGLLGGIYGDVNEALEQALADSDPQDAIYVGGSTFVVADIKNL